MREIKFRFLSPFTGKIVNDHDGWAEGMGINETIKSSSEDYDYKIMQFTGLTDKNGKEIYEGDILKHDRFGINIVDDIRDTFRTNSAAYDSIAYCKGNEVFHDYSKVNTESQSEVIGNIHESPELLGE